MMARRSRRSGALRRLGLSGLPVFALLLTGTAKADGDFGPWDLAKAPAVASRTVLGPPRVARPVAESSLQGSPFWLSFKFYQQVISPIDGATCIHRPTCSLYALQAMHKHPLLGPFFALDRLWRGSDSSALRRMDVGITAEGFPYFKDPLDRSDFWLR